jgi:hypothetical protein
MKRNLQRYGILLPILAIWSILRKRWEGIDRQKTSCIGILIMPSGTTRNTTIRKNGAQNLQTMEWVTPKILSPVQTTFDNQSLKGIRFMLSMSFERHIETIFKLLNAQAFGTCSRLIHSNFMHLS